MKLLSFCRTWTSLRRPLSTSARSSVMWPPEFEDPLKSPSIFKEAKLSGEYARKLKVPIKAADNGATCSIFDDPLFTRFRNIMMVMGRKETADRQIMLIFERLKKAQVQKWRQASNEEKQHVVTNPVRLLNMAVENVTPLLNIEETKVGSVTYNIPVSISREKASFIAMKWIILEARDRKRPKKIPFYEKLSRLILDSAHYQGRIIEKKHEHHRLCEQNRAYVRLRRTS